LDANRFDSLTRSLGTIRSRRGALGGLLVGTLWLLGCADPKVAAAKNCKKIDDKKKRKECLKKAKGATNQDPVSPPSSPVTCQADQRPCRGGCIPMTDCCTAADCSPGTECSGPADCDVTGSCIYGPHATKRTLCTDAEPAGTCTGSTPCECRAGVCSICPNTCLSSSDACCPGQKCGSAFLCIPA
jgi:hypothetical protein